MSFLGLANKTVVVFGAANKKSVATSAARVLEEEGAKVIYVVHTESRKASLSKMLPHASTKSLASALHLAPS